MAPGFARGGSWKREVWASVLIWAQISRRRWIIVKNQRRDWFSLILFPLFLWASIKNIIFIFFGAVVTAAFSSILYECSTYQQRMGIKGSMPGSARQQMFKEEETETPSGPLVSLECNFLKKTLAALLGSHPVFFFVGSHSGDPVCELVTLIWKCA